MFESPLTTHILIALAILAASFLLSSTVRSLLNFIGLRIIQKTKNVLDDRILAVLIAHVKPALVVLGLHFALLEVRTAASPTDQTLHTILQYGWQLVYVAVVLLVLKVLVAIVREIVNWYLDKASAEGATQLKNTLGPLTNKAINLLVGMVAVIIVLDHFGINIGSLLVSLGVGSLAVALAAQDTLANMIAGFVILVDRPFRVGDRIEFAEGEVGDVQQIGLRSTKVLNFDNNQIIIPNADLVKSRIINYSHPYLQIRVQVQVAVAHGTEPGRVREILLRLAGEHPSVLASPAPAVYVTAIEDASLRMTLVARCGQFTEQYAAETWIREQAYNAFLKEGIAPAVASRLVTIVRES